MSDLLKPSLDDTSSGKPIYSAQAAFFVAFFGGPFAVTIFTALNSKILGRFEKEKMIFVGIGLGLVCAYSYMIYSLLLEYDVIGNLGEFLKSVRKRPEIRYGGRIAGVILWGVYYQMHKKYHRAMELFGTEPPSPWNAGLTAAAIDFAIGAGIFFFILYVVM